MSGIIEKDELKINPDSDKIAIMVVKASKLSGVICETRSPVPQAGEFRLSLDPTTIDNKTNLTLRTKTSLPISSTSSLSLIQGPGEYEVMGIKVRGIVLEKESDAKNIRTVYLVKMDGLQLCFLGSIEKDLDEGFLEKIGEIDVLFIDGEVDAKKIISLIKDVDPRIVICYSDENAKMLMKEFGQTVEAQDKVSVKKKDLSEEETKLIWLKEKEK